MRDIDWERFASTMLATGQVFGKTLERDTLKIYWEVLKDLTLDDIVRGIHVHLRDKDRGRFFPAPADIRAGIPACQPKASIIAWRQVEMAMSSHGRYQSVCFGDGSINAVIKDMGGWPWICDQDMNEPWTQKEFERRYVAYQAQGLAISERLPGLFECDNSSRGYLDAIPPVRMIGDRDEPCKIGHKPTLALMEKES